MANQEHLDLIKQGIDSWNNLKEQSLLETPNLKNAELRGANLHGYNLSFADLSGADLNEAELTEGNLSTATLFRSNLSKADLSRVNMSNADLRWANLSSSNLSESNLRSARLSNANLNGGNLSGADLSGAKLIYANLKGANLRKADLSGADFTNANLSNADLSGAVLNGADFTYASFSSANLRGTNFREKYLREANLSSSDLCGVDLVKADLCHADLHFANLSEANLSEANLSHANLSGVNMSKANLCGANLTEANLNEADLRRANLGGADFSGANLCDADVRWANFGNANLQESDFSGAKNYGADFKGADLSDAIVSDKDPNSIDFSSENLSGADLSCANLSGADLSGANFSGANLSEADLSRANLSEADLRNSKIKGADLENADLNNADLTGADLSDTKLNNAILCEADLINVDLSEADLRNSDIIDANLSDTDLSSAILKNANLNMAVLCKSNLLGADLTGANLTKANLTGANLTEVDLSKANLTRAVFTEANFKSAYLGDAHLGDAKFRETNAIGTKFEKPELKQTPQKIVYEFESGFYSIDTIAMDYITMAINNSHPEYNLKLESLTLHGQPKAVFTVAGKDFVEQAKTQIDSLFEIQRKKIGAIVDEVVESITKTLGNADINSVKNGKADDKETSIDLKVACKRCGSSTLAYDSYWKEYTCEKCGWIISEVNLPKENNKPVEIRKKPKPNRSESQPHDSVFSFSRLNLFEKCPMAYKFKYVLKKKEAFSTIEQHLGKCIHKSLEYAYNEMNNRGIPSKNSILGNYNKAWSATNLKTIKVVKSNLSADYYKSEGANMLNSFFDHILSNDKSETVELEKDFEIELDSSIGFRGIIDRISKSSNKVLRITDFKTGKRVGNPATEKQLQFYSLWVFDTFKENKIEVCFEDLRNVETKIAEISRDRMPQIKKNLFKNINRVNAEQDFEPIPSILCSWCGYNLICNDAQSFGAYPGKATWNNGEDDIGDDCPRCGAELEERHGRYGTFIGCEEYPDCRYTRDQW